MSFDETPGENTRTDWGTPDDLFAICQEDFGVFDIDEPGSEARRRRIEKFLRQGSGDPPRRLCLKQGQ